MKILLNLRNLITEIVNKITKDRSNFIFVNIFISGLGFVRSFIFMKMLNFNSLGVITLVQTIILFFSIMQLGLINGGYRAISVNTNNSMKINNVIFSYILILTFGLLIIYIILISVGFSLNAQYLWVILAIFAGLLTLSKNWINNYLIAKIKLNLLNKINFFASLIAMLPLATIKTTGLWGGIISIIIQPLLFVSFALIFFKEVRPNSISLDTKTIKWLLSFGFIPFLTGIFEQFNLQIERWGITFFLSLETLGKFFLPSIFASLFILIPASVNNLFFPKAMNFYVNREYIKLRKIIKTYFLFVVGYSFLVVALSILVLYPLVSNVFPQHLPFVHLIFYILPGLIAIQLSSPISLLFNASIKLKPMLFSYLISMIINFALVLSLGSMQSLSIDFFAILRSILGIIVFVGYLIGYKYYRNQIWVQSEN